MERFLKISLVFILVNCGGGFGTVQAQQANYATIRKTDDREAQSLPATVRALPQLTQQDYVQAQYRQLLAGRNYHPPQQRPINQNRPYATIQVQYEEPVEQERNRQETVRAPQRSRTYWQDQLRNPGTDSTSRYARPYRNSEPRLSRTERGIDRIRTPMSQPYQSYPPARMATNVGPTFANRTFQDEQNTVPPVPVEKSESGSRTETVPVPQRQDPFGDPPVLLKATPQPKLQPSKIQDNPPPKPADEKGKQDPFGKPPVLEKPDQQKPIQDQKKPIAVPTQDPFADPPATHIENPDLASPTQDLDTPPQPRNRPKNKGVPQDHWPGSPHSGYPPDQLPPPKPRAQREKARNTQQNRPSRTYGQPVTPRNQDDYFPFVEGPVFEVQPEFGEPNEMPIPPVFNSRPAHLYNGVLEDDLIEDSGESFVAAPVIEAAFYLSVFGGYTALDDFVSTTPNVNGQTGSYFFDDGYALGAALGQVQGSNLRSEFEFSYRSNNAASLGLETINTSVTNMIDGQVNSFSGMANLYWEFVGFPCETIKPYIGGGIGYAFVESEFSLTSQPLLDTSFESDSTFAYQAMAGVNWAVTTSTSLFVEYRHFGTEPIRLSTQATGSQAGFASPGASLPGLFDYKTNNVFIGLRMKF